MTFRRRGGKALIVLPNQSFRIREASKLIQEMLSIPRAWEKLVDKLLVDNFSPLLFFKFVLVSVVIVAVLSAIWKFGLEELADPYMPGDHDIDSFAECCEFVIFSCLFSAMSLVVPTMLLYRLIGSRQAASRLSEAVFFQSPQPMMVVNSVFKVIAANRAWENLASISSGRAVGKPLEAFAFGMGAVEKSASMVQSIAETGQWTGEFSFECSPKDDRVLRMEITAIRHNHHFIGDHICIFTDITSQRQLLNDAMRDSLIDALTGLPNRRMFMQLVDEVGTDRRASEHMIAVLFIDLDGFKQVNDQHGHAIGDEILKIAAHRLKDCARSGDVLARIGGDEFVMLLKDVNSLDDVRIVAGRCIEKVAAPIEVKGWRMRVGASVGIATSTPNFFTSSELLLKRADEAMYAAKKGGRGRFRVHESAVNRH